MLYAQKSGPAVVEAVQLQVALCHAGPGPFPHGLTIASIGDYLVTDADGQRFVDRVTFEREHEVYDPGRVARPLVIEAPGEPTVVERPKKKSLR